MNKKQIKEQQKLVFTNPSEQEALHKIQVSKKHGIYPLSLKYAHFLFTSSLVKNSKLSFLGLLPLEWKAQGAKKLYDPSIGKFL